MVFPLGWSMKPLPRESIVYHAIEIWRKIHRKDGLRICDSGFNIYSNPDQVKKNLPSRAGSEFPGKTRSSLPRAPGKGRGERSGLSNHDFFSLGSFYGFWTRSLHG
jgi:hypothetical protein